MNFDWLCVEEFLKTVEDALLNMGFHQIMPKKEIATEINNCKIVNVWEK
jgi:hypothetical protein